MKQVIISLYMIIDVAFFCKLHCVAWQYIICCSKICFTTYCILLYSVLICAAISGNDRFKLFI